MPLTDYRRSENLIVSLRMTIIGAVVLSSLGIMVNLMEIQFIHDVLGGRYTDQETATQIAVVTDGIQSVSGILQLVVNSAVWSLFLLWIHRSSRNARALGAAGMFHTPMMAVGSFLIPIINIWRPYMAVKELWRASRSPGDWRAVRQGVIVPFWWLLCLGTAFLGQMAYFTFMRAEGLDQLIRADNRVLTAQVAAVVLYYCMYMLVSDISGAQRASRSRIDAG